MCGWKVYAVGGGVGGGIINALDVKKQKEASVHCVLGVIAPVDLGWGGSLCVYLGYLYRVSRGIRARRVYEVRKFDK